jgi:hypothetical protein
MTGNEVSVKILANKSPQRYAVRRAVVAACEELRPHFPALHVDIEEIKRREEIEVYTPVVMYPSLIVNANLVCVGRFPKKDEVAGWLRRVLEYKSV